MAKFSLYNIPLISLSEGFHTFEYTLDDRFFARVDGEEVKRGNVAVTLLVNRTSTAFEMDFALNGTVQIPCTRCLDDMDQAVDTHGRLVVKFGSAYSEESDEIVIIPESEGEINIAWFLYEFIALAIPIKHVHPPGECNRVVASKFRKHRAVNLYDDDDDDDGDDEDVTGDDDGFPEEDQQAHDPRWDALRGLQFEDD
ncbi:MAG TPA: DUF177 domain-containing protein [Bacteroidales bacterium]|nr:DUF177 domain-containing protein [Bacteroidales bacterium]